MAKATNFLIGIPPARIVFTDGAELYHAKGGYSARKSIAVILCTNKGIDGEVLVFCCFCMRNAGKTTSTDADQYRYHASDRHAPEGR